MENSINKAVTEEEKVTAVILAIQGHSIDKKQVAIVEGEDDADFYERFLNMDECDVVVNNSCYAYAAIANVCNRRGYENRYFLIKDADFDRLLEATPVGNQMLTDFHDREMFLSSLDMDTLLEDEYAIAIDTKAIATEIRGLSMVKWYNMARGCKLAFRKRCVIPKVYDGQKNVKMADCLTQLGLEKKNAGKAIPERIDVEEFAESYPDADWRQYTNGHDWLHAIALWLNKNLNRTISYKNDIRPYLEDKFTLADFRKTSLYAEIEQRGQMIGKTLLKKVA